jgi:hypothetical protein
MLRLVRVPEGLGLVTVLVGTLVGCAAASAGDKFFFNIYGFVQADYIYDLNRVESAWEDALRPSKIPTENNAGAFGSDGQSLFSIKQSRFGVTGDLPVDNNLGDIKFKFEFDLFGVGADAGQTTIRFRHVYGEWGPLLVGQTNSVFMDMDVFPNVIDYWGPTGMVFYRNVQIRLTPYRTENSHFAIAVERPSNDVDPGTIRELDPELGANLQNDEKLPDLTAHYYTSGSWGHVQLAGIVRKVGFDTKNAPDNEPKGSEVGWGVNLSGHAALFDKDRLMGQVAYGQGIASYMNDGGVDLAPEGTDLTDAHAKAVPLLGIEAYYDHYWSKNWSTSLGYSFTQVDNTSLQDVNAFHKGEYASVNLLYTPASQIMIGGELLWGKRTDNDGATGDDLRFQFSAKYSFGANIAL